MAKLTKKENGLAGCKGKKFGKVTLDGKGKPCTAQCRKCLKDNKPIFEKCKGAKAEPKKRGPGIVSTAVGLYMRAKKYRTMDALHAEVVKTFPNATKTTLSHVTCVLKHVVELQEKKK